MKVFLSWSGTLSHQVAIAFREWLPSVVQMLEPYVSSEDIEKGARWSTDIAKELQEAKYGVVCVTKQNLNEPWLLFEAGALSKTLETARVTPFLFGLKQSEVHGPLLQFQSTAFQPEDVRKMVAAMNNLTPAPLEGARLETSFTKWWPDLKGRLESIVTSDVGTVVREPKLDPSPMLEEILELVRAQTRLLATPDKLFPEDYFQQLAGLRRLDPHIVSRWRRVQSLLFGAETLLLKCREEDQITETAFEALAPQFDGLQDGFRMISKALGILGTDDSELTRGLKARGAKGQGSKGS